MRIGLVTHGYPEGSSGGTELYVEALARELARTEEVHVLAREASASREDGDTRIERRGAVEIEWLNNTFRHVRRFRDTYRSPVLRDAAGEWMDRVRPDVLHVHHLTCLSTDLVLEARRRSIPTFFTAHDFWLLCQRGQLLDIDGERCPGPNEDGCVRCMGQVWAGAKGISERTAHIREVCEEFEALLMPSQTVAAQFQAFGIPASRLRPWSYGVDPLPFQNVRHGSGGCLRVGFIGTWMVSKAPHVLLEAFRQMPPGMAEAHLYGAYASYHGDDSYRAVLAPYENLQGVVRHGQVSRARIPDALAQLDVLVVPSVWVENAPFVIREAFLAGVPVVASDLGGMRESVRDGLDGLLFPPADSEALRDVLVRLASEPGLLERLRAGIGPVTSLQTDASRHRALYRSALERTRERVVAIVLHRDTPELTARCLEALARGTRCPDRMLVVDNGSQQPFEPPAGVVVEVLRLPRNLGFAGGANAGLRRALETEASRILFVNSDAEVEADTVQRLDDALNDPRVGLAGPVLLRPNRATESSGARFSKRTGRMRHTTGPPEPLGVPEEVDAISACVMLARREVFTRVGLFEEPLFYGFEDLDLCLRARDAGFSTVCVRSAAAIHQGSATIGPQSPRRLYFAARNHLWVAAHRAPLSPVGSLARQAIIVALNVAHAARSGLPLPTALAAVARGTADFLLGRYGPDPSARSARP